MTIPPAFQITLGAVAVTLSDERDPWWVIGSAAVALHGVDPGRIADVDVLTTATAARRLLAAHGCPAVSVPRCLAPVIGGAGLR